MTKEKNVCKCPTCGGTGQIEIAISYTDTNRPLAHKLKKEGKTIREIAKLLGYKHPGSITNLLSKKPKK